MRGELSAHGLVCGWYTCGFRQSVHRRKKRLKHREKFAGSLSGVLVMVPNEAIPGLRLAQEATTGEGLVLDHTE